MRLRRRGERREPLHQRLEIAVLFLLILLNGLFAMSEMSIVSARKPRLKTRAARGNRGARAALRLLEDPSRMLSTVQIGITLIGVVAGAYGATAIAEDLEPMLLAALPALGRWADEVAFGIVIALTTYLSLVLGELVPKRIALTSPEALASILAPLMAGLAAVSAPVVLLLKASTDGLLAILRLDRRKPEDVTEEDIHSMIDEGSSAGLIEPEEREMIAGVMRLGDRTVRSIMTPRREIVWLDADMTAAQATARIRESGHSRFPVAEGGVDHIIGVVQAKDLLSWHGERFNLRAAMHSPMIVPETLSVLRLLDSMRGRPVRMVFVADQFGVIEGLVTAADLLEAIAGDGVLSEDEAVSAPVRRDDGSWLVDGMMPVHDFERAMEVSGLSSDAYTTVAGLVIDLLQKLPEVGDKAERAPLRFEIVDMDGRRIDKVIVERIDEYTPI